MSVIVKLVIFIEWRHNLLVTVTRESKVCSKKERRKSIHASAMVILH